MWTVSGVALWFFSARTSAFSECESVGLGVELVPAAGSVVEEVRLSVTRVNQLLSVMRAGWISTNFDCNMGDGMTNTDMT